MFYLYFATDRCTNNLNMAIFVYSYTQLNEFYNYGHVLKQWTESLEVFSWGESRKNQEASSRPTLGNTVITLSSEDHQDHRNKHTAALVYYISVVTFWNTS